MFYQFIAIAVASFWLCRFIIDNQWRKMSFPIDELLERQLIRNGEKPDEIEAIGVMVVKQKTNSPKRLTLFPFAPV
jgi:hypothetical protein